jgi:hypothetical protein
MTFRFKILLLAFAILGTYRFTSAATEDLRVPAMHGTALSGDPVVLPDVLQGKVGVLVVGFSQTSRDEVTAWGKRLAAEYRDNPGVLYYEMPVLASVPKMLRGWVTGRIKSTVPPRAQPRFVPIDAQEADWKKAARFSSPDAAYILVVDGTGAVKWTTYGALTDDLYATVRQHVEALEPIR